MTFRIRFANGVLAEVGGHSPLRRAELSELEEHVGSAIDTIGVADDDPSRPEPIAVVGLACRFPGAKDPGELWRNLLEGRDSIVDLAHHRFDVDRYYDPTPGARGKSISRWAGLLEDIDLFDAGFFGISDREAQLLDPQQRLLLETTWTLLESAGYVKGEERYTTGVFLGASHSEYLQRLWPLVHEHPEHIEFHASTGNNLALISNRLSYQLNLTGPSLTLDTACSSSLVAVCQAIESLRSGACDAAIAGGVNVLLSPENFVAASQAGMLSADGRCKTFDQRADGYVRGEGVGLVLLRRLSDAQRDGDPMHAVLLGAAVNQDGRTNGLTAPSGPAQTRLLTDAWRRAAIDPTTLAYVEAHGTGTALGDPIEVRALDEALNAAGCRPQSVAIGSVKTHIGHAEAAAGIASLIKAILVVRHRQIPPTLHLTEPNRHINFAETRLFVNDRLRSWPEDRVIRAGVSSFGMGGTNAHVVVESTPAGPSALPRQTRPSHVFERRSYWLPSSDAVTPQPIAPDEDLYYERTWTPSPIRVRRSLPNRDWYVVDDNPSRASALQASIRDLGAEARILSNPREARDAIRGRCGVVFSVLGGDDRDGKEAIDAVNSLLTLVQALARLREPTELLVLVDAQPTQPSLGPIGSAVRTILEAASREIADLRVRCVGIPRGRDADVGRVASDELQAAEPLTAVAYRGGDRHAPRMIPLALAHHSDPWPVDGTFVIVGGFGDIGFSIARHLAMPGRRIALWGRSPLDRHRIQKLHELSESRAEILAVQGDVADAADVERCLGEVRSRLGRLDVIVHTAGQSVSCLIATATGQDVDRAFSAKVLGAEHLLAQAHDARHIVLCGSASSCYPEEGQGVYAAANAYLDALAHDATTSTRHVISIAWGPWEGSAAASSANYAALMRQVGVAPITTREALDALDRLVAVSKSAAVLRLSSEKRRNFLSSQSQSAAAHTFSPQPDDVLNVVRGVVATVLRTPAERIDPRAPFQEIGLDSILAMELCGRLRTTLGLAALSPTILYEHASIETLAKHLAHQTGRPHVALAVSPSSPLDEEKGAIAIIGMAARFPGGEDLDTFWRLLDEGRDITGSVPAERIALARQLGAEANVAGRMGGFLTHVDQFDAPFFRMTGREAEHVDPRHRLFLEVAYHAIEHAGYGGRRLEGTRTGVYVATGPSDYVLTGEPPHEYWATGASAATLASRLAYFLDLRGPCVPIDTACSSSLTALHLAIGALRCDQIDAAIVGAVHLNLRLENFAAFERIGALSRQGRCQPFAARADGFVPSEGVAAVVLKPLHRAIADGDAIHAVLLGSAMNNDGRSNGLTAPNLAAQRDVLQSAWKDAGIGPGDLDYIEAHGTGTELGDPIELDAVRRAIGAAPTQNIFIGSVKGNIGHAEAAAGMASLIKVILSLAHEKIPASLHAQPANPHFDWSQSPIQVAASELAWPRSRRRRIAGVSAFGFSGTNVHVVVTEPPSSLPLPSGEGRGEGRPRSLQRYVRHRYWKGDVRRDSDASRLFWRVIWEPRAAPETSSLPSGRWLVVDALANSPLARSIASRLRACNVLVECLAARNAPNRIDQGGPWDGVLYVDEGLACPVRDPVELNRHEPLLSLSRKLGSGQRVQDATTRHPFLVVTRGAQATDAKEPIAIELATLLGLARALPSELKPWAVRSIDLGQDVLDGDAADIVLSESMIDGAGEVAYRRRTRLVRRLVPLEGLPFGGKSVGNEGVYLIVGGAGGVGRDVAELLLDSGCASLVIVGRRPADHPEVRSTLDSLRAWDHRTRIEYVPADVSDAEAVTRLFDAIAHRFGRLDGVVQAAGVLDSDRIALRAKTPDSFAAVLAPKVAGSWNIAHELRDRYPSAWLVLLSSISCLSAPLAAGQSDYAAASRFQWSLAAWLRRNGLPGARALLLSEWDQAGMLARTPVGPVVGDLGLLPIARDDAKSAFEPMLAGAAEDVAWLRVDPERFVPERMLCDDLASDPVGRSEQSDDELDGFAKLTIAADEMSLAYLERAFAKLFPSAGSSTTLKEMGSRLGVLPKYERWLAGCFLRLARSGVLTERAGNYLASRAFRADAPIPSATVFEAIPGGRALIALVRRFGERLSDLLAGRCNPVSLLFPDGSLDEVSEIHGSHALARSFSSLAAAAVRELARNKPEPLRILEIGAGTGGTTESMLRELVGLNMEYTFTDVSAGFFRRAEERLAFWPGKIHWHIFDLNRSGVEQGLAAGGFDVAIATNVLHAARRIDVSLAHLRELLAPSGTLLLTELVAVPAWIELTFGLTDGWWAFEDHQQRVSGPILDEPAWRRQFEESGWSIVGVVPEATTRLAAFGQRMFLAKVGAHTTGASTRDEPVRTRQTVEWLRSHLARFARIPHEQLDPARNFMDLGIDSIVALQIRRDLERALGISLEATVTFTQPTVERLAAYLLKHHRAALTRVLGAMDVQSDAPEASRGAFPPHIQAMPTRGQESPHPSALPMGEGGRSDGARILPATVGQAHRRMSGPRDVAVIGMACRFPGSDTPEEFFASTLGRGELIGRMPSRRGRLCCEGEAVDLVGGFLENVEEFDADLFRLSPHEARMMDPQQRLFLETSWEAIERAGYSPEELAGRRCAVFAGTNTNEYLKLLSASGDAGDPYAHSGNAVSAVATRVPYVFDLRGPALAIDSACSSSLLTVYLAAQGLRDGQFELALAGGVNIILQPAGTRMVREYGMLSPEGRSRSFDDRAAGFVRSEGCGVLLLKRLEDALRDRDNILAVIKGVASNNDGAGKAGLPAPSSGAQSKVILAALEDAGVTADSIGLVEAHGTGTALGDPIEVEGLASAFRSQTTRIGYCALGSVKSHIGHAESAAGIAGLIHAIEAVRTGTLPPTGGFDAPNRHIAFEKTPFFVNERVRPWDSSPRRAGVSSFGFGGTNVHVVLEESRRPPTPTESLGGPHLLPLSAADDVGLRQWIDRYRVWIQRHPDADLANVCFTASVGRRHHAARIAILAASIEQLADRLEILHLSRQWEDLSPAMFCYGLAARDDSQRRGDVEAELELLCREHPAHGARIRSLCEGADPSSDADILAGATRATLLPLLGRLYARGANIDWRRVMDGERRRRIELPTYPFQRRRYWLREPAIGPPSEPVRPPREDDAARSQAPNAFPGVTTAAIDALLYESTLAPVSATLTPELSGHWLLLADEGGMVCPFAESLKTAGARVVTCRAAARFARGADGWTIHPDNPADYTKLLADVFPDHRRIHVVHLWASSRASPAETVFDVEERWATGPRSLLFLAAALARHKANDPVQLFAVTKSVSGERAWLDPESSAMAAVLQSVALEHPNFQCRMIREHAGSVSEAAALVRELSHVNDAPMVDVEPGRCRAVKMRPVDLIGLDRRKLGIQNGGCYLITGGMGGIGLELARWLARHYRARLVLVGPTPVARENDGPIAKFALDDRSRRRRSAIDEIDGLGSEVLAVAARAEDLQAMSTVFKEAIGRFGRVDGVFHLAGVLRDGPIERLSAGDFNAVWRPKAQGAWVLDRLTRLYPPDWTIYFSSIAAATGSPHQAVYAAANAYLDGLARARSCQGFPTTSIQWGLWAEVGMGRAACDDPKVRQALEPLPPPLALEAIPRVLALDTPVIAVARFTEPATFRGEPGTVGQSQEQTSPSFHRQGAVASNANEEAGFRPLSSREEIADELVTQIADLLEVRSDEVDPHRSLAELGLDSVLMSRLRRDLESRLGRPIPFTLLRDYPTPWAISEFLHQKSESDQL